MDKYLHEYLEYLEYQKGYSKYTIDNYEEDIMEFNDFCSINKLSWTNIVYEDIRKYLVYLKDLKKDHNNSISRKLSSLRGFYKYLSSHDIIKNNEFLLVHNPKKDKKLPRYFEYNELEELFNSTDDSSLGERNLLILEMLYATGIRVGELVSIKVSDINTSSKSITILGKGNKERIVYYGEYCKEALDRYLSNGRVELNKKNSPYLFINHVGGKLTERGVRFILSDLIKKTSLSKNISPHMIRHSFATHLLNEGCDLLSVQKLLGHESISATQIYTHVSTEHLKDVYFRSFPRAKKDD